MYEDQEVVAVPAEVKPGVRYVRLEKKKIGKLVVSVGGVRAYETGKGIRFQAQIRDADIVAKDPKGRKAISKTFATREQAEQWMDAMRGNADKALAVDRIPSKMMLPELLSYYVTEREKNGKKSESQAFMFARLAKHPLLQVKVSDMGLKIAREYCAHRKNVDKVHPSTIISEVIRINVALRRVGVWLEWGQQKSGGPAFDPMAGVMEVLKQDGLVAESVERKRRPSGEELDALLDYFRKHPRGESGEGQEIPMADIVELVALNAFRRGEVVELKRSGLRANGKAIACMRKDSSSEGGKRECVVPLLSRGLQIIKAQPLSGDLIFPYSADTITQRFIDACEALGIEDLRFHDLRHEAISTLASVLGMTEAMLVSGHKTPRAFIRYVQKEEEAAKISEQMASISLKTARKLKLVA